MKKRFLILAPAMVLLAACAGTGARSAGSVAETIAADPELSTLHVLVARAGLADTLQAAGPYTVFAPTNEAFEAVPAATMTELGRDPARLKALLGYHVLPVRLDAAQIRPGKIRTTQGAELALARAGEFVTVEEAMVLKADLGAGNGVVHKVDRVLMPPRR